MEKAIRKGLIYGILFGIAIAILFIKHYEINTSFQGNEIIYLNKFDYLILILKRGIVGSFFGAFLAFIIFKLNDSLKLSKKMKFAAIIFGICVVGPVIQYLVSLRLNELSLFN
ncbi:hypothetical protein HPK19_24610 [Arthrobacter citreus]|nr:hypothetical protein HPK19_24610 [Arthrobacter citreus]